MLLRSGFGSTELHHRSALQRECAVHWVQFQWCSGRLWMTLPAATTSRASVPPIQ